MASSIDRVELLPSSDEATPGIGSVQMGAGRAGEPIVLGVAQAGGICLVNGAIPVTGTVTSIGGRPGSALTLVVVRGGTVRRRAETIGALAR